MSQDDGKCDACGGPFLACECIRCAYPSGNAEEFNDYGEGRRSATVESLFFSFKSEDQYPVPGRGIFHAVSNPRECRDFDHLIGHEVLIDGKVKKVLGVERFMHSPPWRAGEKIGLLVADP